MIKRVHSAVLLACCAFLLPLAGLANNLRLSGLGLQDRETLFLEITWDNAWNHSLQAPFNHDAAWLFVKVKENGAWKTARLSTVQGESHATTSGTVEVDAVSDGMGVFVRPDFEGGGNVEGVKIHLKLEEALGNAVTDVQVFGVEMVWVNEGGFWLGDGESIHSLRSSDGPNPYWVADGGEIQVGTDPGMLDGSDEHAPTGNVPATWPNGFGGFYCMKYELSQAQYTDFLNCLSADQQARRTVSGPTANVNSPAMASGPTYRNGIRLFKAGSDENPATFGCDGNADGQYDGSEDGQNRACNFLSWGDLLAYLDWAGLSLMTELEYEKASRGPNQALALEFAWGTDAVEDANTVLLDGMAGEAVAENPSAPIGLASHGYDGPQGPLRCGFGAHGSSSRLSAGAAYYGIFELSGNLWELCVATNAEGLTFTGGNGDGVLDAEGRANQADWPGADGGIYRGGGWNSGILPGFRDLAVSDRFYAGQGPNLRRNTTGGRGVRR